MGRVARGLDLFLVVVVGSRCLILTYYVTDDNHNGDIGGCVDLVSRGQSQLQKSWGVIRGKWYKLKPVDLEEVAFRVGID